MFERDRYSIAQIRRNALRLLRPTRFHCYVREGVLSPAWAGGDHDGEFG